jgi:hypothetical protein
LRRARRGAADQTLAASHHRRISSDWKRITQ